MSETPQNSRVILGIDPGSRFTGYGVVEVHGSKLKYIASGCIRVQGDSVNERLGDLYHSVDELIGGYTPDELAIEQVFMAKNPQSALKLGQARGVVIALAVANQIPVYEYAARLVKQTIVGTGRASKEQVQHMVQILLSLSGKPQADAADALAIGLCHVNTHTAHQVGLGN